MIEAGKIFVCGMSERTIDIKELFLGEAFYTGIKGKGRVNQFWAGGFSLSRMPLPSIKKQGKEKTQCLLDLCYTGDQSEGRSSHRKGGGFADLFCPRCWKGHSSRIG